MLEEETAAEASREAQLKEATESERRRLEKVFGVERAKASERIIAISDRHDAILRKEMGSLGLTF